MKIFDLEHFSHLESPEQKQGGSSEITPAGIELSFENGMVTLSKDGVPLFSYESEESVAGVSIIFQGVGNVGTHCNAVSSDGKQTTTCTITTATGLDNVDFPGFL